MSQHETRLRWLLGDYQRISIEQACRRRAKPKRLSVWVRKDGSWRRMPDVEKVWQASHTTGLSFCHFLVRRVFGLTGLEYKQVQAQFGPNPSHSLVGIYQNGDAFAIVMDLSGYSKVSLGGAGLATAAALAAVAYGVSRLPKKEGVEVQEKDVTKRKIETPHQKKTDDKEAHVYPNCSCQMERGSPSDDLRRVKQILVNVWAKLDQVDPINTDTSWLTTQEYLNTMSTNIKEIISKSNDKGLAFAMYYQTAQAAISKMIEYPDHTSPHAIELQRIRGYFDDFNRAGLAQNGEQQRIDKVYLKFLQVQEMFPEHFPATCTQGMIEKDPVLQACKEVADAMKKDNEWCRQLVEELRKEIEEQFALLIQKSCSTSYAKITSLFEKESQEWLKIISPSVLASPVILT